MKQFLSCIVLLVAIASVAACSTLPRHPVPLEKQASADVPAMEDIRAISGRSNPAFEEDVLDSERQYRSHRGMHRAARLELDLLVLSGGGDHGAFGAGFLYGWTRSGTRPEFKLVTGVSTGALIAPFAFLGSRYDDALKEAYTTINAGDIYNPRLFSVLWNDAFANTGPLADLIERYFTGDFIAQVADAHRQGRRLWIATTNLDADRLVVWNMGAIAQSGDPDALNLFRRIILASSSIPGVFPPVLIDVELDGETFDEMHVDGGVKAQLFINAETLNISSLKKKYEVVEGGRPDWRIFIIRNAEVGPHPRQVPRKISAITSRSLASLLKSQGRSDLERIYIMARDNGIDFNWVSVPTAYEPQTSEPFDRAEMNRMFEMGYELGSKGDAWRTQPPGFGQQ